MTSANVVLNEAFSDRTRARGHAIAGIVFQVGSGVPLVLAAALAARGDAWRIVWAVCALPPLLLPLLFRRFPETERFRAARARDEIGRSGVGELLSRRYRSRTLGQVAAQLLMNLTSFSTMTWLLYHPQTALGLSPAAVTAVVIVGGGVGLLGFPLGARFANRWGRRPAVLVFGLGFAVANTSYYWVPAGPDLSTSLALGAAFSLGSICFGAAAVGLRAAAGELFPTRLRGTVGGILIVTSAASVVGAHLGTAWLASAIGAFVPAITIVAAVGAVGYLIYPFVVPETVETGLEESALAAP
jgi:MFS family permease